MRKGKHKAPKSASKSKNSKMAPGGQDQKVAAPAISKGLSRRSLLTGAALGSVTAASLGFPAMTGRSAMQAKAQGGPPPGKGGNIVLKNCLAVLTMDDPKNDLTGADIVIADGKIAAIGKNLGPGGGRQIDCSTLIAMPGFITTHHHKYETPQRAANADGYIVFGPADPEQQKNGWPYEAYSNLQGLWTQGRLTGVGTGVIWELGKPTQEPDDLYLSHLVGSLSELLMGITCATDTSQASHTPLHTDAMIKGLMDSGQRGLFAYTAGVNRAGFGHATDPNGFEFPGAIGVTDWGVGRLRNKYFPSNDQLVTLCLQIGPTPVTNVQTGVVQPYTGWELAKAFGTWINSHNIANPSVATHPLMDDPEIGPKNTQFTACDGALLQKLKWVPTILGFPTPAMSPRGKRSRIRVGTSRSRSPLRCRCVTVDRRSRNASTWASCRALARMSTATRPPVPSL